LFAQKHRHRLKFLPGRTGPPPTKYSVFAIGERVAKGRGRIVFSVMPRRDGCLDRAGFVGVIASTLWLCKPAEVSRGALDQFRGRRKAVLLGHGLPGGLRSISLLGSNSIAERLAFTSVQTKEDISIKDANTHGAPHKSSVRSDDQSMQVAKLLEITVTGSVRAANPASRPRGAFPKQTDDASSGAITVSPN